MSFYTDLQTYLNNIHLGEVQITPPIQWIIEQLMLVSESSHAPVTAGTGISIDGQQVSVNETVTTQGNMFNAANQLIKLDENAKIPAIDGSQITGLTQQQIANLTVNDNATFKSLTIENSNAGIIYKGANLFIHNYYPAGATNTNIFIGLSSGNQTMTWTSGQQSSYNNGIGYYALNSLTTGYSNNVIGSNSGRNITSGYQNNLMGGYSGYNLTTGIYNNLMGYFAGYSIKGGNNNCVVGNTAFAFNETGIANTCIGQAALHGSANFNYSVGIGAYAGFNNIGDRNIFIGYASGYYETGSNKLFIDSQSRTNEADARAKAIIYAIMSSITANQHLYLNSNVYVSDSLQSAKYKSADGSEGVTGNFTSADGKAINIKNGLITSII